MAEQTSDSNKSKISNPYKEKHFNAMTRYQVTDLRKQFDVFRQELGQKRQNGQSKSEKYAITNLQKCNSKINKQEFVNVRANVAMAKLSEDIMDLDGRVTKMEAKGLFIDNAVTDIAKMISSQFTDFMIKNVQDEILPRFEQLEERLAIITEMLMAKGDEMEMKSESGDEIMESSKDS